jgi:predicted nucleic acid-binding protein
MIFLDTSVLVAVAQVQHEHHRASRDLWRHCSKETTAASAHTLAELYSTLTAMPPALRIDPQGALVAIETFLRRLTPVALTVEEYLETLRRTADNGRSGGVVYDALHLAAARKVRAETIYTWNLRHFRALAPELAERIVAPPPQAG